MLELHSGVGNTGYPYHIRPPPLGLCNILDVCRRTKALDQCHSLGYDHNPKSLKIVAKNPQHNDEWLYRKRFYDGCYSRSS